MATISTLLLTVAAVTAQPRGMVLEFSGAHCPPCQQMSPIVTRLEREGLPIHKIDVDQNLDLTSRYGVSRMPTFILVVDGKEIDRRIGLMSETDLRRMIARIPEPPAAASNSGRDGAELGAESSVPRPNDNIVKVEEKPQPEKPGFFDRLRSGSQEETVALGQEASLTADEATASGPMAASVRLRVTINGKVNFGSGTVIDSRQGVSIIASCGHIFRDSDRVEGTKVEVDLFRGGQATPFVGRIIAFDVEGDVGLVSINTADPIPSIAVAAKSSSPKLGDNVAAIGCSGGQPPSREQLRVTAIDKFEGPHNIECTGIPVQGRSGGGLFNDRGELVGVCFAADPKQQRGMYAGLLAIHDLLTKSRLERLIPTSAAPATPPMQLADGASGQPAPMPNFELGRAESNPPPSAPEVLTEAAPARTPAGAAPMRSASLDSQVAGEQPLTDLALGAQIVVTIRNPDHPEEGERTVIINRASPKFFAFLRGELEVGPSGGGSPAESVRTADAFDWEADEPASRLPLRRPAKASLRQTSFEQDLEPQPYVRRRATTDVRP